MKNLSVLLVFIACLSSNIAFSQYTGSYEKRQRKGGGNSNFMDRIYLGGNFGFWFSQRSLAGRSFNELYLEVSPLVGYRFTDKLSAGPGFSYVYFSSAFSSLNRTPIKYTINNYGPRAFLRYDVFDQVALYSEAEMLNVEYVTDMNNAGTELLTSRDWVPGVFLGVLLFQNVGAATFGLTVLYNLVYDEERSPYPSPLVIRVGFFL